jgi:hypothetical protein
VRKNVRQVAFLCRLLLNRLLRRGLVCSSRRTENPASQSGCLNRTVCGVTQKERVVRWKDGNRPAHEQQTIDAEDRRHDGVNIRERTGREVQDTSNRDQPVRSSTRVTDQTHDILRNHFLLFLRC